jgi:hypothetical protein
MSIFHAAWALLNLVLLVSTLLIGYRSYRIFSERFGCLPSGLLILALASTCNGARNSSPKQPIGFSFVKSLGSTDQWSYRNNVTVYGDDVYRITQSVIINPVQNADSLRVQSLVTAGGLTLGTRWETMQTTANLLTGRRASYQSTGTLTWYLLGVPVYTQMKHFEGEMTLREL